MLQKLTILGTGTILPAPGRKCAGYLLETDIGLILLDCGPGTLIQLSELGVDFTKIKYIFLTHFHLDHISDFFAIIHSRWLRNVNENDVVYMAGPFGLNDFISNSRKYFFKNEKWINAENFVIHEVGETSFDIQGLSVKTQLTHHTSHSVCFRIDDNKGKSFFYSGDSAYNENIVALGNETTIAVVECSHSDKYQYTEGHMNVSDVIKYSKKIKTDKLLLSHFYPDFLNSSSDLSLIRQGQNITIANDLDTFLF
jgi:ribonuclease BN (tRNA processing enzyme)